MKNYEVENLYVTEYPGKYVIRVGRLDRNQVEEVVVSKTIAEKYGSIVEYAKQRCTMEALHWTMKPSIQKQGEMDDGLREGEISV
jgi:hypothetical protein